MNVRDSALNVLQEANSPLHAHDDPEVNLWLDPTGAGSNTITLGELYGT
jgi:hypothetical protein